MAYDPKKTGIDDALSLEAIYYSSAVPRDTAVLTILGAVFDKIYFPGVVMPVGGFDQAELNKEIVRIEANAGRMRDRDYILSMLRFIEHAKTLQGFCVFTGDRAEPFAAGKDVPRKMVREIYDAIHGPSKPGWQPMFSTSYHKAMPGMSVARDLSPVCSS
jgi:hypothetical protein